MPQIYYVEEDVNKVLCVDRLDKNQGPWTPEKVSDRLLDRYPDMIYTVIGMYHCETYKCGSCEGCVVAAEPEVIPSEEEYWK